MKHRHFRDSARNIILFFAENIIFPYLCVPILNSLLFTTKPLAKNMLIIEVKDGESIDKALKRYKRKFQNAGVIKELRRRKEFVKPSVQRRSQVLKAVYREKIRTEETPSNM